MSGADEIPQSSELAPGPGFRVRRTITGLLEQNGCIVT